MLKIHLYVQIFENYIRARNIDNGQIIERISTEAFSHPRALVANFTEADLTIKAAVAGVKGWGLFRSVRILMQPMAKCEGGLTQIESRVLLELAHGAGAKKVVIWVGEVLSDDQVLRKLQGH
ncbi:MAG: hypothetical protein ACOH2K_16915 [Burkholderiaceae bacterium]